MAGLSPAQMAALGAVNGYAAGYGGGGGGGGSNAGAAAGMAAMSAMGPYGAMMGAATQLGQAALADSTPMNQSSSYTLGYDNSGWAVVIGDGSNATTEQIKTPNPTAAAAVQSMGSLLSNPVFLLALVAGIGLVVYVQSK